VNNIEKDLFFLFFNKKWFRYEKESKKNKNKNKNKNKKKGNNH